MRTTTYDIAAMSVDAFAKRFGIGRTTAWGLIRRGELPAVKVTRRTLIRLEDANNWLASRPRGRPKMAKKYEFINLHWEGDAPTMTQAIDRLKNACLPVCRASQHHLKIGAVNFWPSTGTVQIDGQLQQRATGIEEVFRILEKSDPAIKYLKRRKPEAYEKHIPRLTLTLDPED